MMQRVKGMHYAREMPGNYLWFWETYLPYISRGKEIEHSFCRFSSPHRKVPSVMQNFTTSNVAKEMLNADQ